MQTDNLNETVVADTSMQPKENHRSRKFLWIGLFVVVLCIATGATVKKFYPSVFYNILIAVTPKRVVYVSDEDWDKYAVFIPSPPVDPFDDDDFPARFGEEGYFPLSVIELNDKGISDPLIGEPAYCQPKQFDPKTAQLTKVEQSGIPSELYLIEGYSDNPTMMIDGWYKEGEDKVVLPRPYATTVYHFGCGSFMTYVIDLYKNNIRQALYNHVLYYDFSDDGKYLYLVMNTKEGESWAKERKIVDLENQTEAPIANIQCVSDMNAFWQGDRLLTYTELYGIDYTTDICVWDESGVLLNRLGADLDWRAGSGNYLPDKIGLLPNEPDVAFVYTADSDYSCTLFMMDMTNASNTKKFKIVSGAGRSTERICDHSRLQFDFDSYKFEDESIRVKINNIDGSNSPNSNSNPEKWSEWIYATAEEELDTEEI